MPLTTNFQNVPTSLFSNCTYLLILKMYLLPDIQTFKLYLLPDFQIFKMYLLPYFQIVPTSSFSNCTYFLIFNMYLLPDLWNVPTSYLGTSWFVKCTYFLCSYFPIAICTYFLCSYFLFYRMHLLPLYLIPHHLDHRIAQSNSNKLYTTLYSICPWRAFLWG